MRFSGLRYPKRRSHCLKIEHLFPIQGSAPPLHASNTTNRSALAANTAVHFNRGRSALWEKGIRSAAAVLREQEWYWAIHGSAAPLSLSKNPNAVGALQFHQFATADPDTTEFISRFGCLNTTNRSALATNTAALQPRAVRFSGLRYPKRRSHSLKIEHLFPIQGSAPPLHASNTTNRSALTANTAMHFNRGRSTLWEEGIRSAAAVSREQEWYWAIHGSACAPTVACRPASSEDPAIV